MTLAPGLVGIERRKIIEILTEWFDLFGIQRGSAKLNNEDLVWYSDQIYTISIESVVNSIEQSLFSERLAKLIYHIFQSEAISDENHAFLSAHYLKNGLEIDSTNGISLVPTYSTKDPETKEQMKSWLKQNAPNEVYAKLLDAYAELGSANPDDAIDDCRQAFEKMLIEPKFNPAIRQLAGFGLLQKAKGWTGDAKLLQTIYDFHSYMGVHTKMGKPIATKEQAKLAIMMTESALWYLIHILNKAKDRGYMLDKWVSV